MIPVNAMYDTSLDASGFPLSPPDFHSQNILITDEDTDSPRITGVIDWEGSGSVPTSSLAQFPLFIVDHPVWEKDDPLCARNGQDQATFVSLMREAEAQKDPNTDYAVSRAYAASKGTYLLEQLLTDPYA